MPKKEPLPECHDLIIRTDSKVFIYGNFEDEFKAEQIDLVRCGKCKWYNPWHANHTNIDGNYCRNIDIPMKPTDFCSYGERRTDDD